jgi:hypothetical protein
MTDELKPNEVWLAGATSESLGGFHLQHVVILPDYPRGRYTRDKRLAWTWAHEDAAHFNLATEANGAVDWVAAVWAGVPHVEQVRAETPI